VIVKSIGDEREGVMIKSSGCNAENENMGINESISE
jgi:hypothetical protein